MHMHDACACVCVGVYVCVRACVRTCMYACMHVCMHARQPGRIGRGRRHTPRQTQDVAAVKALVKASLGSGRRARNKRQQTTKWSPVQCTVSSPVRSGQPTRSRQRSQEDALQGRRAAKRTDTQRRGRWRQAWSCAGVAVHIIHSMVHAHMRLTIFFTAPMPLES